MAGYIWGVTGDLDEQFPVGVDEQDPVVLPLDEQDPVEGWMNSSSWRGG